MDNYNRIRHRLTALNTGGKTMHLIRGIPDHIEDLENGRTYYYSEGLPEYATGDTMASVTVTPWGGDEATELAFGDDAPRLWQHLESLLKFDADKAPQPAPAETLRFKEGDKVRVTKEISPLDRPYVGQVGVIDEVVADSAFPYWVICDAGTEQFNDNQLEPAD